MEIFRIETTVSPNHELTIRDVPFGAGEKVEIVVTVLQPETQNGNRYPLRGRPFTYVAPFDSVVESDWNVTR